MNLENPDSTSPGNEELAAQMMLREIILVIVSNLFAVEFTGRGD